MVLPDEIWVDHSRLQEFVDHALGIDIPADGSGVIRSISQKPVGLAMSKGSDYSIQQL